MIPVLTIDGPSGAGKGAVGRLLAQRLDWHFLDSGAIYRVLGLAVLEQDVGYDQVPVIVELAHGLDFGFKGDSVLYGGRDVTEAIRREDCGQAASNLAAIPAVRAALLARQRAFAMAPGLVADGRDMGDVVFPEALLKVFLTASPKERARRRYNQLKEKGFDVNLPALVCEIEARDRRDTNRSVAPMKVPKGAFIVDSTEMGIEKVVAVVLEKLQGIFPHPAA